MVLTWAWWNSFVLDCFIEMRMQSNVNNIYDSICGVQREHVPLKQSLRITNIHKISISLVARHSYRMLVARMAESVVRTQRQLKAHIKIKWFFILSNGVPHRFSSLYVYTNDMCLLQSKTVIYCSIHVLYQQCCRARYGYFLHLN